ncbi:MAG: hypothetical protein JSV84_03300 [Gemmatimonadota bacterium]|nr:MAG: hypothetical protein JSV84_03300 [Gemmatimonadota bacterium]
MPNDRDDFLSFSLLAKEKEAKRKASPKTSPGPSAARFAAFPELIPTFAGIQTAGKNTLRLPDGPAAQASGHLLCILQREEV